MALEMAPDLLEDRNLDLGLQEMDRDQDKINYLMPLNKSRTMMFVLLLFVTLACLPLPILAGEKDIILEESGIHYPGGFDPNTMGEVRGRAYDLSRKESGPVHFQLVSSDREKYIVLASPSWYWHDQQIKFTDGMEVLVRGSKTMGKDAKLYLIAQDMRILSTNQTYDFRDKEGIPLWRGGRAETWGGRGGLGSPSGSRGGFGGGSGGGGRGRR